MMDNLQKYLRSFRRDYWQRESHYGAASLRREMVISGALMAVTCTALSCALPALASAFALFGFSAMPCMLGIRVNAIRKEMKKISTREFTACGMEKGTFTISGPSRAVNIFVNTQEMVNRETQPLREYCMPATLMGKLAPYFDDCAAAAAQIEARGPDGKILDQIPLVRPRHDYDDYAGMSFWDEEIVPMLTSAGAKKKQEAEARELVTALAMQIQDGLHKPLSVKPIRLKVKA